MGLGRSHVLLFIIAMVMLSFVILAPPFYESMKIGVSCWDINENNVCDVAEDINGDSVCDVNDCRVDYNATASGLLAQIKELQKQVKKLSGK